MNAPIPEWDRPQFQPGGADPFVFYLVYGPVPTEWSVSGAKYRCAGVPAGIDISSYGPHGDAEVVDAFRTGPVGDQLVAENPDLARAIASQDSCVALRGTPQDAHSLNYHRDTVGLITWLMDQGAVGVLDATAIMWLSPTTWKDEVFGPGKPVPHRHVRILESEDPSGPWLHTRGMSKYGRPDISIHNVTSGPWDVAVEIINRFIGMMALGAIVPDGQAIRMEGAPDGMMCHHRGSPEDPDFNNTHIEITWPE